MSELKSKPNPKGFTIVTVLLVLSGLIVSITSQIGLVASLELIFSAPNISGSVFNLMGQMIYESMVPGFLQSTFASIPPEVTILGVMIAMFVFGLLKIFSAVGFWKKSRTAYKILIPLVGIDLAVQIVFWLSADPIEPFSVQRIFAIGFFGFIMYYLNSPKIRELFVKN